MQRSLRFRAPHLQPLKSSPPCPPLFSPSEKAFQSLLPDSLHDRPFDWYVPSPPGYAPVEVKPPPLTRKTPNVRFLGGDCRCTILEGRTDEELPECTLINARIISIPKGVCGEETLIPLFPESK